MSYAWPDESIAMLRTMWAEGKSASQIAGAIGHDLTRNACIGKINRLGLRRRQKPVADEPVVTRAPVLRPREAVASRAARRRNPVAIVVPAQIVCIATEPAPCVKRVTLFNRQDHQCANPVSKNKTGMTLYCGARRAPGRPYCAPCDRLIHEGPRKGPPKQHSFDTRLRITRTFA